MRLRLNKFMQSGLAITFLMTLFVSCAPGVSLHFDPEPFGNNGCQSPGIASIHKIAILPFAKSTWRSHEYVSPISGNTVTAMNVQNNMDRYRFVENDGELATIASERILTNSGKFEIVERQNIMSVINEQKFMLSGLISEDDVFKVGNLLGADAILVGRVNSAYSYKQMVSNNSGAFLSIPVSYVTISVKLIDTHSGKLLWSCIGQRNSLNYLKKSFTITNSQVLDGERAPLLGIEGVGERVLIEVLGSLIQSQP
jgi:curli biogenesis system outer membrane secretion channel CsgG